MPRKKKHKAEIAAEPVAIAEPLEALAEQHGISPAAQAIIASREAKARIEGEREEMQPPDAAPQARTRIGVQRPCRRPRPSGQGPGRLADHVRRGQEAHRRGTGRTAQPRISIQPD